ncbi:MAG TPA: asparaginase [Gemmatimonadales bacterium]|nr:asparaginase [Gemmatimonadales bacterium]
MAELSIAVVRDPLVESIHHVSAAVVTADGHLLARAGNPDLVTYWRSASKPFQLYPLVADGGVERFGIDREMLALACSSHNAEPMHRTIAARWLTAVGLSETDLACGGHPSLWPALADTMIRDEIQATPLWSNCSGNHAALLGLARLHQWPTAGYEAFPHPVQQRVATTVAEWSALPTDELVWGVDGCTAAAVALSLRGMARAYAQLAIAGDAAAVLIRDAMMHEPYVVAGAERLDTTLMEAWPLRVMAKTGAEGVYSAALPELGLGIAVKVEDGDSRSAPLALVAVLEQVVGVFGGGRSWDFAPLERWRAPEIRNTRGAVTGRYEVRGALQRV